jgi:hypothetical protein
MRVTEADDLVAYGVDRGLCCALLRSFVVTLTPKSQAGYTAPVYMPEWGVARRHIIMLTRRDLCKPAIGFVWADGMSGNLTPGGTSGTMHYDASHACFDIQRLASLVQSCTTPGQTRISGAVPAFVMTEAVRTKIVRQAIVNFVHDATTATKNEAKTAVTLYFRAQVALPPPETMLTEATGCQWTTSTTKKHTISCIAAAYAKAGRRCPWLETSLLVRPHAGRLYLDVTNMTTLKQTSDRDAFVKRLMADMVDRMATSKSLTDLVRSLNDPTRVGLTGTEQFLQTILHREQAKLPQYGAPGVADIEDAPPCIQHVFTLPLKNDRRYQTGHVLSTVADSLRVPVDVYARPYLDRVVAGLAENKPRLAEFQAQLSTTGPRTRKDTRPCSTRQSPGQTLHLGCPYVDTAVWGMHARACLADRKRVEGAIHLSPDTMTISDVMLYTTSLTPTTKSVSPVSPPVAQQPNVGVVIPHPRPIKKPRVEEAVVRKSKRFNSAYFFAKRGAQATMFKRADARGDRFCVVYEGEEGRSYASYTDHTRFLEAYKTIHEADRHFYEIIREVEPVRFYLDIEFKVTLRHDDDAQVRVSALLELCALAFKSGFDVSVDDTDWVILDGSRAVSAGWKHSYHVNLKHVYFENNQIALKSFMTMLRSRIDAEHDPRLFCPENEQEPIVDFGTNTKNRVWRLPLSSKLRNGTPLLFTADGTDIANALITIPPTGGVDTMVTADMVRRCAF